MNSRLRRPAGALLATAVATSIFAIVPAQAVVGGTISGTVTGPSLGPLEFINVIAQQEVPNGDTGDTYWENVDFAETDAAGDYEFSGLPDGTYRIEFGDRLNPNAYASEFYNDQATVVTAQDIVVADGAPVENIDAKLALESTISGTVTGASDEPLAKAGVYLYERANGAWALLDEVETDATGDYTLSHLPRGIYRVEFQYVTPEGIFLSETWNNKPGDVAKADDITVLEDMDVTAINAQLIEGEHDPVPFQMTAAPTVGGTTQVGSTLTATGGSWVPTPATTEFYWFSGEDYTGVSGPTYVLTAADLGKTFSVLVQVYGPDDQYDFANTGTIGPITAVPVASPAPVVTAPVVTPVPAPVPAPVVSFSKKIDVAGALKVGSTLKLKNFKALVSRAAVSYKIQWYAGSKKIKKATKSKLKVTKTLKGKKISVKVTAISGTTTKSIKVKVGKIR